MGEGETGREGENLIRGTDQNPEPGISPYRKSP